MTNSNDKPNEAKSPWLETLDSKQRKVAETMLKSGMTKAEIEAEFEKRSLQETESELVTVKESQLSEEERETFKAAFLEKDTSVKWQNELYRIVTMDQDYPDDDSDHVPVSFQLKKLSP